MIRDFKLHKYYTDIKIENTTVIKDLNVKSVGKYLGTTIILRNIRIEKMYVKKVS